MRKATNDLELRSVKERVRMKEGLALLAGEAAGAAEAAEDLSAPSAFASYAVGVKPTPRKPPRLYMTLAILRFLVIQKT